MAAADNPYYVRPANIFEALMTGNQGYGQASLSAGQKAAEEALAQGDAQTALARLIGVGAAKGSDLAHYVQNVNGVYGTPIYGTGPKGEPRIGTFTKQGQFHPIDTGDFTPTPGVKVVDTPQGQYVISGKSGAPVGGGPAPVAPGQPQPNQPAPSFYPKDYRNTEADKVLGKETGEKQAALGKAELSLKSSLNNLDQLQVQANELLHHPGLSRITGVVGMLPNVPGFPGADAQAKLDTLKSKVGFAALQAMRDASKTGGALGQVSDFENKNLQNSMAELQNAQSEGQIKLALAKIVKQIDVMKGNLQQAYDTDYAGLQRPQSNSLPAARFSQGQPVRVNTPDEARKLPSGTPIVLPDGSIGRVP